MKATVHRSEVYKKTILIFGAGKIGRSFIGQLFGKSGYEVVFVDVDEQLVNALNEKGQYRIIIKAEEEKEIIVRNIRALLISDIEKVKAEIVQADLMSISVGKNAIQKIIQTVAEGIRERFNIRKDQKPLDIILAENMRSAADFVRNELKRLLPGDFHTDKRVGLIETSIGKMVPIMTNQDLLEDPLCLYAEPYNELILDKKGFRNSIPDVKGLAPKENIKAWVDRKVFIHNLGHATAAYFGFYCYPNKKRMYEVLEDRRVLDFTRGVMVQSMEILLRMYPDDFTKDDLLIHIQDLLDRFRNKYLGDTVFRVGQDLRRKLGPDDRFVGAIKLAQKMNMPYDKILQAFCYGFYFKASDDKGDRLTGDVQFIKEWELDKESVLLNVCGLHNNSDRLRILKIFNELS